MVVTDMSLKQTVLESVESPEGICSKTEQASPLKSLMLAAMALPGLALQPAQADDGDSASFQYGHYYEGERDLAGVSSKFKPIEVESLHESVKIKLGERWKGTVNYTQDSWSGATPIATAPSSARGNRISTTHVMTGASMEGMHHMMGMDDDGTPTSSQHAVTGASPYLYTALKLDGRLRPLLTNSDGKVVGGTDEQLVHTMSSASRETRKQIDFTASREVDDVTLDLGGGISRERDYESLFGNVAGHWNFNRKQTIFNAGLGYASGTTNAVLDHDATPHIYEPYMYMYERRGSDAVYNNLHSSSRLSLGAYSPTLTGKREDWTASLGVTQLLNKSALLEASFAYTRSSGYLSNPYKAVEVAFIDPLKQAGTAGGNLSADYTYDAEVVALMEQRPDLRNQGALSLRYVQHVAAADAALHMNYRYFQDSWRIQAHTLETQWVQPLAQGWSVSPKVRYYTQTAASFYTPYLTTQQGLYSNVVDPVNGPIYINTKSPNDSVRYWEDQSGATTPPIDPNPASRNYGKPVVGLHGGAVINRQTGQAVNDQTLVDALKQDTLPFDRQKLPDYYSSDPRLSGYGTMSAGITLAKQFAKGINLEVGYEHWRHAGSLKWGGGGEGSYADYAADWFNIALTVDLDAKSSHGDSHETMEHAHHDHHEHAAAVAPAGVMFDHMLSNSGDVMVGYRYMYGEQSGSMLHGGNKADDYTVINQGCGNNPCYVRPTKMDMRMHMFDIMYAASDNLTLMLMPQYVEMNMSMQLLDGSPRKDGMDAIGSAIMHSSHPHTVSGLGDTEMHALLRLKAGSQSEWHLGLGLSAPTGDVDLKMRDVMANDMGFMEYGMQLGSGTWDFKPSLTYTATGNWLSWGAQVSGTKRLENQNKSGYALGDVIQTTAWGSHELQPGMSASVRAVYTSQGPIRGEFNGTHIPVSTGDYGTNYGGRFFDVGLGMSAVVQDGSFRGNRLGIEWLQPVKDDPNGYQLKRSGTLLFNWGIHL
ncbi:MAG: DUF3570 domain-containing protein [Chitinivorax sp.]